MCAAVYKAEHDAMRQRANFARLLLVSYRPLAPVFGNSYFAAALTTFLSPGPRRCLSAYHRSTRSIGDAAITGLILILSNLGSQFIHGRHHLPTATPFTIFITNDAPHSPALRRPRRGVQVLFVQARHRGGVDAKTGCCVAEPSPPPTPLPTPLPTPPPSPGPTWTPTLPPSLPTPVP